MSVESLPSPSLDCPTRMCVTKEKVPTWFDQLVQRIAGHIRKDSVDVSYDVSVPNEAFYLSSTFYVDVRLNNRNEKDEVISLVVKRPPQSEILRKFLKAEEQFHNEILFYEKFAGDHEDVPRCAYTCEESLDETTIVLENVNRLGYQVLSCKCNVPMDYTVEAMRAIGRFHGKAYTMKEKRRADFDEIVNEIHETRYTTSTEGNLADYMNLVTPRAVYYLESRDYDETFCEKMKKFLGNVYENVMMKSVKPVEPLATICHGDFSVNNMLFKCDGDDKRGMLIDFAMMRYSSPAIDLSTYFALCCSNELMRDSFHEIFVAYYDALRSYLVEHDVEDLEKYSYEALLRDYKERALFGFVIASFFLPTLMGESVMPVEEIMSLEVHEMARLTREVGGENVSKILADMLLILKDNGCLTHIL